jgi:hypothetical protein
MPPGPGSGPLAWDEEMLYDEPEPEPEPSAPLSRSPDGAAHLIQQGRCSSRGRGGGSAPRAKYSGLFSVRTSACRARGGAERPVLPRLHQTESSGSMQCTCNEGVSHAEVGRDAIERAGCPALAVVRFHASVGERVVRVRIDAYGSAFESRLGTR